MVFSAPIFLIIFLPAVLLLYYNPVFKSRDYKNVLLFLASIVFYGSGEPVFVFLMLFSILITWIIGLKLDKTKSRKLLTVGIVYHVFILFVFKYLSFVATETGLLLGKDLSYIKISLPIGISFFTFQLMSFLFDIYYGKAKAQKNVLYLGLYVAFFPQLIAGPIVRYETVCEQINERMENSEDFCYGVKRFVYGLGKKLLLADYMAVLANNSFLFVNNQSVLNAWLGAISYSLQIYFDFSGYSDMAIGLGRMFGFKFEENFNYPYISGSVTEFWRRWHISLSTWFRDYVYIPLGGNRLGIRRQYINLFFVWLLTGIWHGANWTFMVWGLMYFVFLAIEKKTGLYKNPNVFTHIYTGMVFVVGWIIFKADNLKIAFNYIGNLVGINTTGLADESFYKNLTGGMTVLIVALFFATPVYSRLVKKLSKTKFYFVESMLVVLLFFVSLMKAIGTTYSPFIYFNF